MTVCSLPRSPTMSVHTGFWGAGQIPKSTLIRKLEAGDRNIYREYIAFCNYKGKRHAMLLKRRKAEFALLYIL